MVLSPPCHVGSPNSEGCWVNCNSLNFDNDWSWCCPLSGYKSSIRNVQQHSDHLEITQLLFQQWPQLVGHRPHLCVLSYGRLSWGLWGCLVWGLWGSVWSRWGWVVTIVGSCEDVASCSICLNLASIVWIFLLMLKQCDVPVINILATDLIIVPTLKIT